jgi:hypothetical protein
MSVLAICELMFDDMAFFHSHTIGGCIVFLNLCIGLLPLAPDWHRAVSFSQILGR